MYPLSISLKYFSIEDVYIIHTGGGHLINTGILNIAQGTFLWGGGREAVQYWRYRQLILSCIFYV